MTCAITEKKCTLTPTRQQVRRQHKPYAMLEHLINGEFHPEVVDATAAVLSFEKADPTTTIDAKVKTAEWLKNLELEDEEIESKAEQESARKSFASLVTGQPVGNTQQALANLKTPAAVQHLVGMLTAYDWAFVEQAKELRGDRASGRRVNRRDRHHDGREFTDQCHGFNQCAALYLHGAGEQRFTGRCFRRLELGIPLDPTSRADECRRGRRQW